MWSRRQSWSLVVMVWLVAACVGCGDGPPPSDPESPNGQSGTNGTDTPTPTNGSPTGNGPLIDTPPPPPKIPEVFLTQQQKLSCVVLQGDIMPDAELPDLEGKLQQISKLRGQELTVVCFWRRGDPDAGKLKAVEVLADLQALSDEHSAKGVHVVGINEGDPVEVVRACVAEAAAAFPNLLDEDGAFFDKVAADWLPRVYLLDSKGDILWFDLEFSQTTRRNLEKGIQVALGEI